MKQKYTVYMNVPGECKGCGKHKWEYLGTTYDPTAYKRMFPMLNLKFKTVGKSSEVKIIG
jgi:hypothetical protein